ncbi:hypothetical protein AV530_009750 [Patagioenas fasciata monilis]|uniref:Uncharacterized protein n=1 Tax=Patagioenas fasciata monilis TaxID=372326 RepID=A0A1V4K9Y3_PATFA|nr:hypothetical protein AV530_009750 [Patagioenas fasciata monilis]
MLGLIFAVQPAEQTGDDSPLTRPKTLILAPPAAATAFPEPDGERIPGVRGWQIPVRPRGPRPVPAPSRRVPCALAGPPSHRRIPVPERRHRRKNVRRFLFI